MARRFAALGPFHVFAVEDTAIQFAWRGFPDGLLTIDVGPHRIELEHDGGPGAVTISGLQPDTSYECVARAAGDDNPRRAVTRTLPAPPGPELCRIATINDMHIGSSYFGFTHTMTERPRPRIASGLRCAQAAVDELDHWGIRHLFIKGDAIDRNLPREWDELRRLIEGRQWSTDLSLGNHERRNDHLARAGVARSGLAPIAPVRWADLPGVRVIMAETALRNRGRGTVDQITEQIADLSAEADGPAIVFMHHHLETTPVPHMLPVGIRSTEANAFISALLGANPNVVVASGHSHRHRRRDARIESEHSNAMVTVVEVGSTKDYPGTWGGYAIHEGGIRQVVRRVERPNCIAWTDYTRRAVFGAWGRWSPGSLADRCWTRTWSQDSAISMNSMT